MAKSCGRWMALVQKNRHYSELREILPAIDWSVQALLRIEDRRDMGTIRSIWKKAQELQELMHRFDLVGRYPKMYEVVCFIYLSCFSLLYLNGESFHTYRDEVKQRYKLLLRALYSFRHVPSLDEKRISNL